MDSRLKSMGETVGIEFTGKPDRYPNTLQAHALLEYTRNVKGASEQNKVAEELFKVSIKTVSSKSLGLRKTLIQGWKFITVAKGICE